MENTVVGYLKLENVDKSEDFRSYPLKFEA